MLPTNKTPRLLPRIWADEAHRKDRRGPLRQSNLLQHVEGKAALGHNKHPSVVETVIKVSLQLVVDTVEKVSLRRSPPKDRNTWERILPDPRREKPPLQK